MVLSHLKPIAPMHFLCIEVVEIQDSGKINALAQWNPFYSISLREKPQGHKGVLI